MKRLLFLTIAVLFTTISVNAQDVDSSQTTALQAHVDSLSMQLNRLQHDYDFLFCEQQLNNLRYELRIFINEINSSKHDIEIQTHHTPYSGSLYRSYKDDYDSSLFQFDSLKKKIAATQELVSLKISNSTFTDKEINILKLSSNVLDQGIAAAEISLNRYKVYIKGYLMQ